MAHSRKSISLAIAALIAASSLSGQECQFVDPPPSIQLLGGAGSGDYASWNGWYMPPQGIVRILVVLVEVNYANPIYDPTPPGGTAGWPAHQMPTWADNPDPSENHSPARVCSAGAPSLSFATTTRPYRKGSSGRWT